MGEGDRRKGGNGEGEGRQKGREKGEKGSCNLQQMNEVTRHFC